MASRIGIIRTSGAILATLMIGVPSLSSAQARGAAPAAPAAGAQPPAQAQGAGPAGAQGPGGAGGRGGRGRGGAAYTPAAGAKDLKAVIFNWGWYTGMLRSDQEYDVLM